MITFLRAYWLEIGLAALALACLLVAGAERTMRLKAQRDVAELRAQVAEAREKFQAQQRAEEARRMADVAKVQNDAQTKLDALPARNARAGDSSVRLQHALDIATNTLRTCGRDTAAATPSPTASDAARVLADVHRELDRRAGIYAATADESRIRGLACEQIHDAVKGR